MFPAAEEGTLKGMYIMGENPLVSVFPAAEEGTLKGMYIMGENPLVSDPDLHHIEKAVKELDFMVVQDIFLTETAQLT